MIRNKYKIEKKSRLELAQEDAAAKAADLRATAADKTVAAKDTVKESLTAGVGIAAAKAQDAVEHATPVVDKAHDTLVDDVLPKIVEILSGVAAAGVTAKAAAADKAGTAKDKTDELDLGDAAKTIAGLFSAKKIADKADEMDLGKKLAVAGLSTKALDKAAKKQAKKERKGGKGLIALGLLATAAAVAAVVYQKTAPQDDPWATPLADPYTGPMSSTMDTGAPIVSDHEVGDPLSAVSTEPVILDAKDQEQLAATTPTTATDFDRADDGVGQEIDHNAGSDKPDTDKF